MPKPLHMAILAALVALLAIAVLAVSVPAFAEVWTASKGNGDTARLTEEPCANKVILDNLAENVREFFMAGSTVVDGVAYQVCWRRFSQFAFLVYEDGDKGLIPWREVRPTI